MNRPVFLVAAALMVAGAIASSVFLRDDTAVEPRQRTDAPGQEGADFRAAAGRPLRPTPDALRAMGIASTNFLPTDFDGLPPKTRELTVEERGVRDIFREPDRRRMAEATVFFGSGPKHGDVTLDPDEGENK